jgi:hypothetical protein
MEKTEKFNDDEMKKASIIVILCNYPAALTK